MARFEKLHVTDLTVDKVTDKTSGNVTDLNYQDYWVFMDDFDSYAVSADITAGGWTIAEGSDNLAGQGSLPITGAGGILQMKSGDGDGTMAVDGVTTTLTRPMLAQNGAITVEARLRINTAITGVSVNFGLTDTLALEEPFSIATATISDNADDAVCFVYDDGATSKTWFACATDGSTQDTGNGTTGVAPVADTWQILKIVTDATGNTNKFYINNKLVKTLTNAGFSPDVSVYPVIAVNGTGDSAVVDVDYVRVTQERL